MKRLALVSLLTLGGTTTIACGAPDALPSHPVPMADHSARQPARGLTPAQQARIEQFITERLHQGRVPGLSLAIVKDGVPVFAKGYGSADLASGTPMTERTRVSAGSTMKTVTAAAVMQLVEQGKVDLEAPVTDYLPWFQTADGQAGSVRVKHLLSHTSGLPESLAAHGPSDDGALEAWVRGLAGVSLLAQPGTGFRYSNNNFAVAGLIVQTVLGETIEQYIARHLFQPAGMHQTVIGRPEVQDGSVAQGYGWTRGAVHPWVMLDARSAHAAGSAFYTTAEDAGHYLATLLARGQTAHGARILSAASVERMWTPEVPLPDGALPTVPAGSSYGLGWILENVHGEAVYRHGGAAGTSGSDFIVVPGRGLGVAVLANLDTAVKHEVALGVLSLLLGQEPASFAPPLPSCPPSQFAQYAGALGADWTKYTGNYLVAGVPARIYVEDSRLLFAYHDLVPATVLELEPSGLNAFVIRDRRGSFECLPVSFVETPQGMGMLAGGAPLGVRLP